MTVGELAEMIRNWWCWCVGTFMVVSRVVSLGSLPMGLRSTREI